MRCHDGKARLIRAFKADRCRQLPVSQFPPARVCAGLLVCTRGSSSGDGGGSASAAAAADAAAEC